MGGVPQPRCLLAASINPAFDVRPGWGVPEQSIRVGVSLSKSSVSKMAQFANSRMADHHALQLHAKNASGISFGENMMPVSFNPCRKTS